MEEKWVPCCYSNDYEVSNLGKFRNAQNKKEFKGSLNKSKGYIEVTIHHSTKRYLHRAVYFSFHPEENEQALVIDHINGIKTDNRLENLQATSNLENINLMLAHQHEYIKEFSRLVKKYGYDKALQLVREIQ